jgi:hypothetical protein
MEKRTKAVVIETSRDAGNERVFRPEREATRGTLVPVVFSECITVAILFVNYFAKFVTDPDLSETLNEPVDRTATRPTYSPIFFPVVTIAFTMSPV